MTIGQLQRPFGPVVDPGGLGDDLVEAGMDEVGELDLGDRPAACGGHADAEADDERLGEWGVEAAVVAERLGEADGGLEHATLGVGDVLAEDGDLRVGRHDLVERPVDGRDQVDRLRRPRSLRLGRPGRRARSGLA